MKSNRLVAVIYPWLNLYGGGEVFLEYCNNLLTKSFSTHLYYYNNKKKIHKKLKISKKTNLISVNSKNFIIDLLCSKFMIFAQAYLIYYFNKHNKNNYQFVFSASGEFFSKFKTIQYIHICIFSLNFFEYKNFGLSNPFKKFARFLAAILCRIFLRIDKKKLKKVYTLTNSQWSLERINKTYIINNKKVLYPTFKIPTYKKNDLKKFNKRDNKFVVLGRVSEDKKIIEAINFFNRIKKILQDAELHIIGPIDKNYLRKIKLKIKDFEKVFFHGLISLNKRDNLLKRSKYGLNCFYSEHFGRSTLEMQKLGMIVFAKNAGGVREILLSDFQKFHSYNELFDNIIKIHFDTEVKEQILINNKKLFKKSLTDRQFSKSFISNFN